MSETHDLEARSAKRFKFNDDGKTVSKRKSNSNSISKTKKFSNRCNVCTQRLDDILNYNGHPQSAVEESIALTNPKLMLFSEENNSSDLVSEADRPVYSITSFTVYCKKKHLCPFDTGLLEQDAKLYFSGYINPIYLENPLAMDGIPSFDMGPIIEWWITGFDGGDKALVCFSTEYADYYLVDPSSEYIPLWDTVQEKIYLSKKAIEFLLDEGWQDPEYEDLLCFIRTFSPNAEELLHKHGQFLCDQVTSFDTFGFEHGIDSLPLMSISCMRTLIKRTGPIVTKKKQITKKSNEKPRKLNWTKATTTQLIRDFFEQYFKGQISDANLKSSGHMRRVRCGVCDGCLSVECGKCTNCRNMKKFHGSGKSQQTCKQRTCKNMKVDIKEESDDSDDDESKDDVSECESEIIDHCSSEILHDVVFPNKPIMERNNRKYHTFAEVGKFSVFLGSYVMLNSRNPRRPSQIGKITLMWENKIGGKFCHLQMFVRGSDTILGTTAAPRELYIIDRCEDVPVGSILKLAAVQHKTVNSDWSMSGGIDRLDDEDDDGYNFYFSHRYERELSRFVNYNSINFDKNCLKKCESCKRREIKENRARIVVENGSITWNNGTYSVGTCVYLKPEVHQFKEDIVETRRDAVTVGQLEEIYPEFYRKMTDNGRSIGLDVQAPLIVARIEEIISKKAGDPPKIKARIFYRPDHVKMSKEERYVKPLTYVYWTDEIITVSFKYVTGKCHVVFGKNFKDPFEWSKKGPHRFYFEEYYNAVTFTMDKVPNFAMKMGSFRKEEMDTKVTDAPVNWPQVPTPFRTMDVFAGCGGLTAGLHQAGICNTKWAIEKEEQAAKAFQLNYPKCKVYTDDCNDFLHTVMHDRMKAIKMDLPNKGDVEMLVGGPPCQGFSGMNRFNAREYSLFKNSLIATYLSFCEYYRPKYFLFENVRNFVTFKYSVVLKLTLRCLLAMGYQVTFGVVQAGHYGVPQTRRRVIIMAAAPGYVLPKFPEPMHSFHRRGCQLDFVVDGVKFATKESRAEAAPLRAVTVRDALSDLPDIDYACSESELHYNSGGITHYQRLMRAGYDSDIVRDHVCKEMAPLVEARIREIPTYPGADWRDLPNIEVTLRNGVKTQTLAYLYRSKRQDKKDPPRGVCRCATGATCNPSDRQMNTLIPWCLPHTADRHNNWSGLYGRLEYDGFFRTTTTNPEPMGKQGKVLHPEQNRVVSVRECARSQGFPDSFKFFGTVLDKYRQVGNAVPPPLACAIGREFNRALNETPVWVKDGMIKAF